MRYVANPSYFIIHIHQGYQILEMGCHMSKDRSMNRDSFELQFKSQRKNCLFQSFLQHSSFLAVILMLCIIRINYFKTN